MHRVHVVQNLVDTLDKGTWAHTYWSGVVSALLGNTYISSIYCGQD